MRGPHHRARRSGALVMVLLIVAAACASEEQRPTLADSRGAADTAAAIRNAESGAQGLTLLLMSPEFMWR